jgi:hypothetical protein
VGAALTVPVAAAALVLAVAGIAKLRAPGPAADALASVGIRVPPVLVRAGALAELTLGVGVLGVGGALLIGALSAAYAGLSVLAVVLARRRVTCGCFGAPDSPATGWHAALSAVLAACAGVAAGHVHPLAWWAPHPAALLLATGTVACAYAVVLAYTALPAAWGAWGPR